MKTGVASRLAAVIVAVWVWCQCGESFAATRFAVIGDYGADTPNALAVANLVKQQLEPEFVVTVGDNNYGGPADIDRNIGRYYHEFIGNYKGEFGAGAGSNRFFPAIGNHDHDPDGGYEAYLNYFTLPGNGRYYEVRHGPVHLFFLNSDLHEPDGTSSDSAQANWLSTQMASSTAPWRLVVLHHAPYSSSYPTPSMRWPFGEWGAHAVLAGHAHNYERILLDGLPWFVNGLGGHSITPFNSIAAGSAFRYNADYGAMLVTATDSRITFEFYSISNGGTLIDSYSLGPQTNAPVLSVRLNRAENVLVLSWAATAPGLDLQESSTLKSYDWHRVSTRPAEEGDNKTIVLPADSLKRFYRLHPR
jgi:tartrate-resistant acid phosphatase type 5